MAKVSGILSVLFQVYACMMVFFLSNMIENQCMSTGAFEITLNGEAQTFSSGSRGACVQRSVRAVGQPSGWEGEGWRWEMGGFQNMMVCVTPSILKLQMLCVTVHDENCACLTVRSLTCINSCSVKKTLGECLITWSSCIVFSLRVMCIKEGTINQRNSFQLDVLFLNMVWTCSHVKSVDIPRISSTGRQQCWCVGLRVWGPSAFK